MEKILEFRNTEANYIVYGGKLYYYNLSSGRIGDSFIIKELLSNPDYYNDTLEKGFKYYEKEFYNKEDERKTFYIPLSKEFIEYYRLYWKEEYFNEAYIPLYNTQLKNRVEAFYEFSLEIEINSLKTKFLRSVAYKDMIYIIVPTSKLLKEKMSNLLGSPQHIPELENDKYGRFSLYYIVPTSKIDKIIGVKRFRDATTLGQQDGEQFTGETKELILNLHSFNNEICKSLKQHINFTIEGY